METVILFQLVDTPIKTPEGQATVIAALIGGMFMLIVAIIGWIISSRNKNVEIKSAEGLRLRGMLEEQAAATTELREKLADCDTRHVDDERRILAMEKKVEAMEEKLEAKDFQIKSLRFELNELRGHA